MEQEKSQPSKKRLKTSHENPNALSEEDENLLFVEGSEVSALTIHYDWASTSLGPLSQWPPEWKATLSLMFRTKFALFAWLGKNLHSVYNAGTGKIELEETYWTYSYSPVKNQEGKCTAVLSMTQESTQRHIGERRLRTLRDLAAHSTEASTVIQACEITFQSLKENLFDIPLVGIYLYNEETTSLRREQASHPENTFIFPSEVDIYSEKVKESYIDSALSRVLRTNETMIVDISPGDIGKIPPWNEPTRQIYFQALQNTVIKRQPTTTKEDFPGSLITENPHGVLMVGINSRRKIDSDYTTFLNLLSSQVTTALNHAQSIEVEKKRAEALRQLDETKTIFFNNISHEFRTPLSLMIGPLDELVLQPPERFSKENRENLELAHRNSNRLLKLVNVLMDFSRIEAGRMKAIYAPTDLSSFTLELVSLFRAACDKEGLQLQTKVENLNSSIYVDADMWEKIVLNLLSNAYKFTLKGFIRVSLKSVEAPFPGAQLIIEDSGCGVPKKEMPRLFERFHRVTGSKGRSYEGTGIGLALVYELVKLHGGQITAESELDKGTKFFVTIPFGHSHLPAEQIDSTQARAIKKLTAPIFAVPERKSAIPDHTSAPINSPKKAVSFASQGIDTASSVPRRRSIDIPKRLLVVDDNPDMLSYISRILSETYEVVQARDGLEALEITKASVFLFDLIVSDVMMPRMDGFGLVENIRKDARLEETPIILLSARAGEEAKSEGIERGADDYLVKPFGAKELLSRVSARIELSKIRAEAMKNEQKLREEAEKANRSKDHFMAVLSHELRTPLTPALIIAEDAVLDTTNSDEVKEKMNLISQSINLEVQLIDDLLDLTKISQHKVKLRMQIVDMHNLIQQTMEMLKHHVNEKRQRMIFQLDALQYEVLADPARLQQIFWNLIKNAIKFTPEHNEITLKTSVQGTNIRFEVIDTGIGIEADLLPKLFNAFEQGGDGITKSFGGLGLGLNIAKALATMHRGDIEAFSEGKNKGARFVATIPLISAYSPSEIQLQIAAANSSPSSSFSTASQVPLTSTIPIVPPQTQPQSRPKREGPLRVLLIEDNPTTILILSRFLTTRLGYKVFIAKCVAEGIELVTNNELDLVLSDIGLPDGDGCELFRAIKQIKPTLVGVALSGFGTDVDIQRSLEAGFTTHLVKPVKLALMEHVIRALDL